MICFLGLRLLLIFQLEEKVWFGHWKNKDGIGVQYYQEKISDTTIKWNVLLQLILALLSFLPKTIFHTLKTLNLDGWTIISAMIFEQKIGKAILNHLQPLVTIVLVPLYHVHFLKQRSTKGKYIGILCNLHCVFALCFAIHDKWDCFFGWFVESHHRCLEQS